MFSVKRPPGHHWSPRCLTTRRRRSGRSAERPSVSCPNNPAISGEMADFHRGMWRNVEIWSFPKMGVPPQIIHFMELRCSTFRASRKHPVRQGFLNPQQTGFHKTTKNLPQSHQTGWVTLLPWHRSNSDVRPLNSSKRPSWQRSLQTSRVFFGPEMVMTTRWVRVSRSPTGQHLKDWALLLENIYGWFSTRKKRWFPTIDGWFSTSLRVSKKNMLENHPQLPWIRDKISLAARGDHLRWCLAGIAFYGGGINRLGIGAISPCVCTLLLSLIFISLFIYLHIYSFTYLFIYLYLYTCIHIYIYIHNLFLQVRYIQYNAPDWFHIFLNIKSSLEYCRDVRGYPGYFRLNDWFWRQNLRETIAFNYMY